MNVLNFHESNRAKKYISSESWGHTLAIQTPNKTDENNKVVS